MADVTIAYGAPATRWSLRARFGEGLPATVLTTAPYGDGTALCLGPDEWLLVLPEGAAMPVLAGAHATTDVSHRNVSIVVAGAAAEALIQCGCALDLAAFPVGKATRTLYEGVEIVLWRTGVARFHVEVWRSFAPYLWDALTLAAGDL